MTYSIELNPNYSASKLGNSMFVIFIDGKVLTTFDPVAIICMDTAKIIPFLEHVLNGVDFDVADYSRVSFGEYDFDGEILVPKGMVGFSNQDSRTIIDKKEFYQLCLDLAKKSIDAFSKFGLKEKEIVNDLWIQRIKNLIPEIENKVLSPEK